MGTPILTRRTLKLSGKINLIILLLLITLLTSGCTTKVGKYEVQYEDPKLTEENWCPETTLFGISNHQTGEGYSIQYTGIETINGVELCNSCAKISNENGSTQFDILFDNSGNFNFMRVRDGEGNIQMVI
jgi:hypothetical protein